MSIGHNSGLAVVEARGWTQILGSYRKPNHARSIAELDAAWFTFSLGYAWAPLLIAIPAAGFLVRLFMIQHDCGHGTFFANRQANDWIGRVIGTLTLTPYDFWRRALPFIMRLRAIWTVVGLVMSIL